MCHEQQAAASLSSHFRVLASGTEEESEKDRPPTFLHVQDYLSMDLKETGILKHCEALAIQCRTLLFQSCSP